MSIVEVALYITSNANTIEKPNNVYLASLQVIVVYDVVSFCKVSEAIVV